MGKNYTIPGRTENAIKCHCVYITRTLFRLLLWKMNVLFVNNFYMRHIGIRILIRCIFKLFTLCIGGGGSGVGLALAHMKILLYFLIYCWPLIKYIYLYSLRAAKKSVFSILQTYIQQTKYTQIKPHRWLTYLLTRSLKIFFFSFFFSQ